MLSRQFIRSISYSHAVIGGGVVGLAITAQLAKNQSNSIVLLERHRHLGTEISARNSEVIHAGLYYEPDALRTQLCIRGKELIYETAKKTMGAVQVKQCGKLIVAQTDKQMDFLSKLYERSKITKVPLEWLAPDKAVAMEPSLIARAGVLHSPTTGIISAHSLMDYLEAQIQQQDERADIALGSNVVGIEKISDGYRLRVEADGEEMEIDVESVINCAGLNAVNVQNMILPVERHLTPYYAKGNYFSYSAGSKLKVSRLIYPCPADNAGLGTHLTIDLGGAVKFGPDVQWVSSPDDLTVTTTNLDATFIAASTYLRGLEKEFLTPDYCGIRPKIVKDGSKFQDFVIREEEGFPGFINLLSIESPGLTSSMAIGEYVEQFF